MHINIDKILSEYKGFFADSTANTDIREKGGVKGYTSVSFQREKSEKEQKAFLGYDKNSKLINSEETGENKSAGSSADNITEFLNNAIDTLKNLVTDEDYSRMAELGITADKDDMKTIVTVYERIQIQLAAYGDKSVSGLNISSDKIDKVIKSKSLANGVKMAESIGDIEDGAKEYLIKNNMEPTVENIYMAVHSNEKSPLKGQDKGMTSEQWEQLTSQVEKFMEKNGIEADEKAMDSAKWLLDRELPLTVDNLVKYMKLQEIESGASRDMESVKANMIMAELFNTGAADGYMTTGWIDREQAADVAETIQNADDDTVWYIAEKELTLNVANLKKYSNASERKNQYNANGGEQRENSRIIRARQIMLEAKAVMTTEGALLMEKLGISITYTEIEEMVSIVKEENNKFASSFLVQPDAEKTDMLASVMDIMKSMTGIPVAAVGAVVEKNQHFDIQNVYDEGIRLKQIYEKAGETYEAVGTEVRADLGDSMGKAFRNIDIIIEETGLKADAYTRRAVRILGYNSMDITQESIVEIAEKASEVDRVIKNITPKTAAYLIENGINPLNEDIDELNDRLLQINNEIGADENEEYAKYLWKLEKSGAVTQEERQAYIELYRSLKQIEKADTRAIGAVVREGAALTLGNLLMAEKSRSKYGMNMTVDEKTGYYQGRLIKNRLEDILENITGKIPKEDATVDSLEEMYLTPENMTEANRLNNQYEAYIMHDIKDIIDKAQKTDDIKFTEKMIFELMEGKLTPSAANMAAEAMLMTKGSEIRMMLKDNMNSEKKILDRFNSDDEAMEAYEEMDGEAKELYSKELQSEEPDYQRYRSLSMATGLMVKSAKNKCYNIPVDINGEDVMVKVRFYHGEEEAGTVNISLKDSHMGSVEAKFKAGSDTLSGVILCGDENVKSHISSNMDVLIQEFDRETDIAVTLGETEIQLEGEETAADKATDRELYEIAKTFLKALKVWSEMSINNIA